MKTIVTLAAALALSLLSGTAPAAGPVTVTVTDAWARAGAPAARAGAAFLTVTNGGAEADRLMAAKTPVAERAELHTHLLDNGVMKMREVDAIEVAPGSPVVLRPGGLHVMLLGLKQPLTVGTRFPVTLTFAKSGEVTVEVTVQGAAAMGPGMMGPGAIGHGMGQPMPGHGKGPAQ